MADFGTDAWIARLQRQAAGLSVPADAALRIEQRLDDGAVWHLVIADGTVAAHPGPDPEADVTITTSRATAAAIAAGEQSAQRAFLDGDFRVGGDVPTLLTNRSVLATIGQLLRAQ